MTKIRLLCLLAGLLSILQTKAQMGLTCINAVPITQPFSQTYSSGMGEFWFKTTPTTASLSLSVTQHYNQINVKRIELYAGNCSSLALVKADSLSSPTDSVKSISTTEIKAGATYYIRVVFIDKSQKYDYTLSLAPLEVEPLTCMRNLTTGVSCCIDEDFPDGLNECFGLNACVGDIIELYNDNDNNNQTYPIEITPTSNPSGIITVIKPFGGSYFYTCTTAGSFTVKNNGSPANYSQTLNVFSSVTPIVTPVNGSVFCKDECVPIVVLNPTGTYTNVVITPPFSAVPCYPATNSFLFPVGLNTFTVDLNSGLTCSTSIVVNITIVPKTFTITATSLHNCSLTQNINIISSCTSISNAYDWYTISSSGVIDGTNTSPTPSFPITFASAGVYTLYVTDNSTGIINSIVINVPPAITPIINITSSALSLCDVTKVIKGQAFITLNPNVIMGTGDVATWTATDANTFATLSIPYTIGANGVINYNMFAFTSYPNPINFCVDLTVNGCENKQCFTLFPCCPKIAGTIVYSNTIFTTNTTLTNSNTYRFSGVITINPGVHLYIKYADVSFDPNTKINILSAGILSTNHSYLHGCSAMWDGIYLYNNSQLDIDETTIEDAKRAVVDTLGANDININYSWFNKNYESVIFKYPNTTSGLEIDHNYFTDDHIPTAYTTAPIYILASSPAPATVGAYTRAHLLPPYNAVTIKPYSGITLYQTKTTPNTNQYVIIGDNNIFDKLHYGVVATRSKLWVRKNSFFNMDARNDAGVFIYGASTLIQNILNPSDAKIGGTVAEANDFNSCYNGVLNNYASALTVRNNNFIFSNAAITVSANNRNKLVTIDRNKINATKVGIVCFGNVNINAQITENTLVNATAVGLYNANIGISANEVITTTAAKYNVYNNSISGYFNGIYATKTYSTQITDNEVHLIPTASSGQDQYGIRIEGTNLPFVINNTIDKPSADYNAVWQNGIYAGTNTTPIISCNQITNMGTSLKFDGSNMTINGFGIILNTMSFGKYGIWLNNSAEIGNQNYFGSATSNNQWIGFNSSKPQTYTSNGSNISHSVIFTKTNTAPIGNSYFLNNANATTNFSGGAWPLLGNTTTFPFVNVTCNATIVTPLRMQNATKIATNTMGFMGNTANLYTISKRQLLDNIKYNNLNISTDAVLKAFVDSAYTTHIGQFYQVDSIITQAIATGSVSVLNTARTLNNSIANTGNMVYNKQTLNATYMNMLSAEPDSTTLANLRDLAVKCPNLDGDAVFQARGILMYYDKQLYTSFCESDFTTTTNHRLGNTDNAVAPQETKELIVYPNPTNRDITIEYTKGDDNEAAELIVFNQLGELVLTKTLTDNKTTLSLEQLNSGIYFYTIKQQGAILKTSKLVITK